MANNSFKHSKIPILKKVKILKPLKNNDSNVNCCEDQFKYCRNCTVLKENLRTVEQNFTTLLKENNLLRHQLASVNQSGKTKTTEFCEDHSVTLPQKVTLPNNSQNNDIAILDSSISECITLQPYSLIPGHPFSEFDVNTLDQEISYSHDVNNRKIKFYGAVPYEYSGVVHQPCNVPKDCYLLTIIDKIKVLFPHFNFNSVLINKYVDGNDFIPMHSDNEKCIKQSSDILTVSLGETRTINFQPINRTHAAEVSESLQHGDVFIMSAYSQNLFKHGIPQNSSTSMRISLTFRDLTHPQLNNSSQKLSNLISIGETLPDENLLNPLTDFRSLSAADTEFQNMHEQPTTVTETPINKIDTIYISSSMFADLDHTKLSSSNHSAAVFFYRGATARGLLHKLQNDPYFNNIDANNIKQIFLLCGTNDIDNILNVQRSNHSNVNIDLKNYDEYKLEKTTHDIYNLVDFLHSRHIMAKINILNILPRASISRNTVINHLNHYLMNLCTQMECLSLINTEFNVNLFSSYDGYRKNAYFKTLGSDNVHLNKAGIVRLGKHLKYLSHLDCPRMNAKR